MSKGDEGPWYVDRKRLAEDTAQGPYSTLQMHYLIAVGKVTMKDWVSQDKLFWEPITQVPQFIHVAF